jgi:hypothetical protein
VGGVQVVTLSDEEARRRGTRKSVLERKAPPTFDVLVEIKDRNSLAVYHDIARMVDRFLSGTPLRPELRTRSADGKVNIEAAPPESRDPRREPRGERVRVKSEGAPGEPAAEEESRQSATGVVRIYPLAVSRVRLEKTIREMGLPARLADQPLHADLILTLKGQRKRQPKRLQDALNDGAEFRVIKSNTSSQIRSFLADYFGPRAVEEEPERPAGDFAIGEAEDAIVRVQRSGEPVELSPQNSYVRRLQRELVEGHGLYSESKGKGLFRRVVIYPRE